MAFAHKENVLFILYKNTSGGLFVVFAYGKSQNINQHIWYKVLYISVVMLIHKAEYATYMCWYINPEVVLKVSYFVLTVCWLCEQGFTDYESAVQQQQQVHHGVIMITFIQVIQSVQWVLLAFKP